MICYYLAISTIIFFNLLFSLMSWRNKKFFNKYKLIPFYSSWNYKEYYRIITSGFIYYNSLHLFLNFYIFYFYTINSICTNRSYIKIFFIYIGSMVFGNFCSLFFNNYYNTEEYVGSNSGMSGLLYSLIFLNKSFILGFRRFNRPLYGCFISIIYLFFTEICIDVELNKSLNIYSILFGALFGVSCIHFSNYSFIYYHISNYIFLCIPLFIFLFFKKNI